MAQFTVIQSKRTLRIQAKSIQALTKALRGAGIHWQGIHEDKD